MCDKAKKIGITYFIKNYFFQQEASKDEKWVRSIEEEIKEIEKNDTQKFINFPLKKNSIDVKWVFKTKINVNNSINKHQAKVQ